MSLPNYLAKIKSSGIYRFVWDKSEITATDAETLRLVVGYSEKGPFNTPVYVDNTKDFKTIFGDVNKKLEKRGVFFHRMALQALQAGPIIAFNVKKFDGTEKIGYATATTINNQLSIGENGAVKVYNTSRFWLVDPEQLVDFPNADPIDVVSNKKQYVTVAETDSEGSSCTLFMRPSTNSSYDVTIKTWYTTIGEDMPDYFMGYENLKVSDFLAEIYVFRGEFTPALANTVELKKYFDIVDGKVQVKATIKNAFNQDVDALDALASNENSQFIQKYVGVTLPYFKDTNGSYISLDLIFNKDYENHKMIMKFNSELLDDEVISPEDLVTVPSYSMPSDFEIGSIISNVYDPGSTMGTACVLNSNYNVGFAGNTVFIGKYKTNDTPIYYERQADDPTSLDTVDDVDWSKYDYEYCLFPNFQWPAHEVKIGTGISDCNIVTLGSVTAKAAQNGLPDIKVGDKLMIPVVNCKVKADTGGGSIYPERTTSQSTYEPITVSTIYSVHSPDPDSYSICIAFEDPRFINANSKEGDEGISIGTEFNATYNISQENNVVHYLDEGSKQFGFIKKLNTKPMDGSYAVLTSLIPTYLKGYTMSDDMIKPASGTIEDKLKWQKKILDAINPDSTVGYPGLVEALTNGTDVDYRYIVDTFESYPSAECKSSLALIAKTKDNAMLLTNFPAIKSFIKMNYVDNNGAFNINFVKDPSKSKYLGGDPFSLPSAENGASWCSFNTPVVFTDGTVKTTVPAAALVSNNFMTKYSTRQPYYIVAGPTYGRLLSNGLVGPDYNFSRAELDVLEPMGVNATVYVPRKGTYINSNQTAKQTPVTALSKINIRELVIYLQDQIHDLLQNYQWEFNTQSLRDLIKNKADSICGNIMANGGLHRFENVCDETNNTDDVINNEMLVLSTFIEPGMGAGKMVQELTIYKKGGMTSIIR